MPAWKLAPIALAAVFGASALSVVGSSLPAAGASTSGEAPNFWVATPTGAVYNSYAEIAPPIQARLAGPVVGIASTPDGKGYWLVGSDGGVFAYGDATFYGSAGNLPLAKPVVGIASTPDGKGYWLVGSDGGVFAYGDATFYGTMAGRPLDAPVKGITATPGGSGYWLSATDGGVFSFGDAHFEGATIAQNTTAYPNLIIGALVRTSDGMGYWLPYPTYGCASAGDAGACTGPPGTVVPPGADEHPAAVAATAIG